MCEAMESVEMECDQDSGQDITSSQPAQPSQSSQQHTQSGVTSDGVSSNSDLCRSAESSSGDQSCDCSSSICPPVSISQQRSAVKSQQAFGQNECDASGRYEQISQPDNSGNASDSDTEIVVDSPSVADNAASRVVSSNGDNVDVRDEEDGKCSNSTADLYMPPRGMSRSMTPSPPYIRLATPSTPGTPRLRSGSVSGTTFAPVSPKPSARNTPMERQRAGSMGEIEMRERMQGMVRINESLDILQLPRPRNPGGILPQNGHDSMDSSNEALNLIMDFKLSKDKTDNHLLGTMNSFGTFRSVEPVSRVSSSSKRSNTSYLISNIIRSTPNKLKTSTVSTLSINSLRRNGCSINEAIERPKPSSIIDSEGVAKKIARLDSGGFMSTSTLDSVWRAPSRERSRTLLPGVRMLGDKTPPERPKPPRRTVLSPADNGHLDLTISSSMRRHSSPSHSQSLAKELLPSGEDYDGDVEMCPHLHHYRCRLCNYATGSYNLLQMHSTKHSGGSRTFRCSVCDFTSYEKGSFRRHRRLHHKTSPVNLLRCVKCQFVTPLSRKLRDHYQQAHPDLPASTLLPGLTSGGGTISPTPLSGNHTLPLDTTGNNTYPAHFYDNSLLLHRSDRLTESFPYSMTNRHPVDMPFDQYNVPYESFRDRQGDALSSSYLRSLAPSGFRSSQQAATSTVTSSSYYIPSGVGGSHIQDIHTCSNHGTCDQSCSNLHTGVKIKIENDFDISSSVSGCALNASGVTHNHNDQRTISQAEAICDNPRPQARGSHTSTFTNGNSTPREDGANRSATVDHPTDLTSPNRRRNNFALSATSHQLPYRINVENIDLDTSHDSSSVSGNLKISSVSDTVVKSDSTARGVQCVLPLIKTEIDLDGDYYDFYSRPRFAGIDQAIQCNLPVSGQRSQSQGSGRLGYRSQSASESDQSEQQSCCSESRCEHCGIVFDDEVIFSIHLGCHSHTDPFRCNVCGKQCGNKYGFYSHIMRGHHI
ncbi:uncharacterized protein LOC128211978 [Mya arenaria]|uniref:uncharacterized protein LOC128211978 n=1 Tax=Mya arenaria TaxID=6604 RepID=UPI0022E459F6|nr:uncharacterized protein LOC128211978 [Mya arenaria]